jgi:chromosome segregation ATPase
MLKLSTDEIPPPDDIAAFGRFLNLIGDPVVTKTRLEALAAAAKEARELIEQANGADAKFSAARDAHEDELKAADDAHASKLEDAQAAFDAECVRRDREIRARETRTAELLGQAQRDADAAAALKVDLQRRLDHLRAAVDPRDKI